MRARQGGGNRQPQATPICTVQARPWTAKVAFKHTRQLVGGDTNAVIGDAQLQLCRTMLVTHVHRLDTDNTTRVRITHGIVQQQGKKLAQTLRVAKHMPSRNLRIGS